MDVPHRAWTLLHSQPGHTKYQPQRTVSHRIRTMAQAMPVSRRVIGRGFCPMYTITNVNCATRSGIVQLDRFLTC